MRRFLLLGALVGVVAAILAATAGARTETRFSVIAHNQSAHRVGPKHFVVKGSLLQPGDRDNVLGSFKAKFASHGRIHAVAFFPDGKIKIQGRTNANRIPIIGGTRRWNGAAGKLKTRQLNKNNSLLTFIIVQ
jgi:hypothetical protein